MNPSTATIDNNMHADASGAEMQRLIDERCTQQTTTGDNHLSVDEIIQKNICKHVRSLAAFFTTHHFTTEKHNQHTNVINRSDGRTYCIPDTHMEEFFTALDLCRKANRTMHYMERQEHTNCKYSGIMLDFDHIQRSGSPQIGNQHIEALTRQISKLLLKTLDFKKAADGNNTYTFHIFYIRKPNPALLDNIGSLPPEGGPYYKDGLHVLIPEIQVIRGFKHYLQDEIIDQGMLKHVFKDIEHVQDINTILDINSKHVPVHFFGSSKRRCPPYVLTHVHKVRLIIDEDDMERCSLDAALITGGRVKPSEVDDATIPINACYELSLTWYTSTFGGAPTWLQKRHIDCRAELETKIQVIVEKSSHGVLSEEELRQDAADLSIVNINNPRAAYIKKLLRLLSPEYSATYNAWFKVICAIGHCGQTEDYKIIAREFSKRCPTAWSASAFDKVWIEATDSRFGKAPVTLASILYWAKNSSPVRFAALKKEYYGDILRRHVYENGGKIEHAHAADVCYAMCGEKFVVDEGFSDITGRTGYCWYEFVTKNQSMKHGEVFKWRKEMKPDNVHLFIAGHLPKVYTQVADDLKTRKDGAKDKGELKYWTLVDNALKSSKTKLGNDGYQNGIINQAVYRYRKRGFTAELDSYEDIIGVGNGIVKIGPIPELIKGYHEYRISKYTETDYVPFDPENHYVKTLLKAFHDIFPEPDVFNYMMIHASTGLDYRESSCILTLLVGGGQNGKSFFAKMIHNTLGHMYCASGKSALLTAPLERSESANSAQMQQKDKRWFYIDEFNKSELLNTGRVKMMVTPQWQSGREMYSKQGNFKNTSNTICFSNFDFIIDTTDHGTWRRIYYYKNKVKFCKAPRPGNPYEKQEDRRFIDVYAACPFYRQAMLSILVHYYSIYCTQYNGDLGSVPVPTIARETEDFRNRQDAINRFITQMIVRSPSAEPIAMGVLAGRYQDWYSQNIRQKTTLTVPDIQAQMENSRLAASLERRAATVVFLVGHRIKAKPEEPLELGESDLYQPVVLNTHSSSSHSPSTLPSPQSPPLPQSPINNSNIQLPPALTQVEASDEPDAPHITALERNAPGYLPTREPQNDEAINDFLRELSM